MRLTQPFDVEGVTSRARRPFLTRWRAPGCLSHRVGLRGMVRCSSASSPWTTPASRCLSIAPQSPASQAVTVSVLSLVGKVGPTAPSLHQLSPHHQRCSIQVHDCLHLQQLAQAMPGALSLLSYWFPVLSCTRAKVAATMSGNTTVASAYTFTLSPSSLIFPQLTASSGRAPASLPSNSCAVLM
jgi:hypothetical protein